MLVNFEKRLEQLKATDQKRIRADYLDMIEWYLLLCKNPRKKLADSDNTRPI